MYYGCPQYELWSLESNFDDAFSLMPGRKLLSYSVPDCCVLPPHCPLYEAAVVATLQSEDS